MAVAEQPVQVEVDGERFEITPRQGQPGTYDYSWLSGPDAGYGYSSSSSDPRPLTPAEHEQSIRDFLAQTNPETGHLD
ncbi:hypothetical protein FB561_4359 [Kribbella amoyensis]|uniref:Uncharacterized protein n=1 Tax=Kribbella amoyensis TaxID=996641 RepID=A0A561BWD4_9ACTN|nr:hypothetical protein [Kribbella amoyensis]TWD83200.1 hypothetical protein FB561_4359 [Kribbella amoyensis]